ncbi:MAG: hypothetical protein IT530_08430 [Burkholderiales bacterium]|nr:hypothetical protein [Burkholderiales bacterium]
MAKILLIVAVFALAYFVMRGYARSVAAKPRPNSAEHEDDMVRCRHCGIHLPRGESVGAGADFYCSEEHRKIHGP